MATRSTIAMEQPDGRVMQIYCHWDGYPSGNGVTLMNQYQNRAKVLALMLLGDLSSLGAEIGPVSDISLKENYCSAYMRDRGETGCEAKVFKNFDDYVNNHQYEAYEYIYRLDDQWMVHGLDNHYQLLSTVVASST